VQRPAANGPGEPECGQSAISRIENHAGDIRLSTIERYAQALGWTVSVVLQPPGEERRQAP
jgi:hypothetical protein